MQKRQMCTQEGNNVGVCAINGNFDDAQTGVKKVFAAADVAAVMLGSRRLAEMDFKKATGHAIQQEILHVRFERVELLLRRRA